MTKLLAFLTLLSLLLILVQAGLRGDMSAEAIALSLVVAVIAISVLTPRRRREREERRSIFSVLFGIGLPITSLLIFLSVQSDGDLGSMGSMAGGLLAILIALFGISIIISTVFRK